MKIPHDNKFYTYDIHKSNKIIKNATKKLKIEIYVLFIKLIREFTIIMLFSIFNVYN